MSCSGWVITGIISMFLGVMLALGGGSFGSNVGVIFFCYGMLACGIGCWNRWYHCEEW